MNHQEFINACIFEQYQGFLFFFILVELTAVFVQNMGMYCVLCIMYYIMMDLFANYANS